MAATLFIADLHLSDHTPELTTQFFRFLHRSRHADALYILGDLFEAWTGDDSTDATADAVARVLKAFSRRVPVYFIAGNRDFLLGRRYAARAGITLLPENHLVSLYGTRYLLCHGDHLCGNDVSYQRYRKIIRHPLTYALLKCLPAALRRKLAAAIRGSSRRKQQQRPHQDVLAWAQVSEQAVQNDLHRHRAAAAIIHGHTHRPAIHHHQHGDRSIPRYVLPDWYGRDGGYLHVSSQGARLHQW